MGRLYRKADARIYRKVWLLPVFAKRNVHFQNEITIDIGGGSSDVTIWQQNKIDLGKFLAFWEDEIL